PGRVARAGVFGSTARGEDRSGSDLDVVLQLGGERPLHTYRLMDLEDLVQAKVHESLPDVPGRRGLL
ncbi:nucleotidyltransferase domain-containing protein, partial [Planococcus sp. SIMBA_160]